MQAQAITSYMRQAMRLAALGTGTTFPNPLVGAVVVKNGRVVGKGFHKKAGGPHAEILALRAAGRRARGGALFCTFEPCFHQGRTGACVGPVIASGVKEVYVGIRDPNPETCGKSVRLLRKSGIRVTVGILQDEIRRQNAPFFCAMTKQRPLVTIKVASSLDGKIATRSGESRWITSPRSRAYARAMRRSFDAIMVGINTVLKDDPGLEGPGSHRLAKIIVDSSLKIPLSARLLRTKQPVIIACVNPSRKIPGFIDRAEPLRNDFLPCRPSASPRGEQAGASARKSWTCSSGRDRGGFAKRSAKLKQLVRRGVLVIRTKSRGGRVDLADLLRRLGVMEIRHVLVEGGAALTGDFLDHKLADRAIFYFAPLVIGGRGALSSIAGRGVAFLDQAAMLRDESLVCIGRDFVIEGRLVYRFRGGIPSAKSPVF